MGSTSEVSANISTGVSAPFFECKPEGSPLPSAREFVGAATDRLRLSTFGREHLCRIFAVP
jgi:hypothetical protein